jgi:phosphoribosylformimino-5-aminoimidazole carboxamide ribotide isomerase
MFEVIPAVDILNGKCVRLKQGRYDAETVYAKDPLKIAKKWEAEGATRLHVVDLDGARTGTPKNIEIIKSIVKETNIPVQVGGGVRNFDLIKKLIDFGVNRIILGTTAVKNPNLIGEVCEKFADNIIVGIDAKAGKVATEGWTQVSKKDTLTLAKEAIELGVKRFIYTDISRDGMLTGPNYEGIKKFVNEIKAAVIASGGISSKEDIEKLKQTGVEGCILGKALYDEKIQLKDVL